MISQHIRLKEIASVLEVSITTVSGRLQDHPGIFRKTKDKIKKIAKEMNYEPNPAAVSLRKGKSFTIGLIVPEIGDLFYAQAVRAIEDTAINNGYMVVIVYISLKVVLPQFWWSIRS